MKKFWLIFLPIGALLGAVYFLFLRKKTPTTATAQTTTNTQTGSAQWFPGWNGFTSASITNLGASVTATQGLFRTISNAFGVNDGGNNPGVSTGGSASGGSASSGSGVGLPSALSNITSLWNTAFNQNNYSSAPLNNYDVLNATTLASSANAVDTGVNGYTFDSSLNF